MYCLYRRSRFGVCETPRDRNPWVLCSSNMEIVIHHNDIWERAVETHENTFRRNQKLLCGTSEIGTRSSDDHEI